MTESSANNSAEQTPAHQSQEALSLGNLRANIVQERQSRIPLALHPPARTKRSSLAYLAVRGWAVEMVAWD